MSDDYPHTLRTLLAEFTGALYVMRDGTTILVDAPDEIFKLIDTFGESGPMLTEPESGPAWNDWLVNPPTEPGLHHVYFMLIGVAEYDDDKNYNDDDDFDEDSKIINEEWWTRFIVTGPWVEGEAKMVRDFDPKHFENDWVPMGWDKIEDRIVTEERYKELCAQ